MPTYEYACRDCGHHVEVVQSMSDDPLTVCSVCGGPLRKVYSPIGIVFKGSGFYRNDSRTAARDGERRDGAKKKAESTTSESGTKTTESSGSSGSGSAGKPGSETKSSKPVEKSA